jgi:protein gp37
MARTEANRRAGDAAARQRHFCGNDAAPANSGIANKPQAPAAIDNPVLVEHAEAIRNLGKRVIGDVIEIGHRLTECKRLLEHGHWLPWLEREFKWSDQTARNFMQVYELAGKTQNLWNLSLPVSGVYLLAAPSTPEEARNEIIERAEAVEKVSTGTVKETIAKSREQPAHKTTATVAATDTATEAPSGKLTMLRTHLGEEGPYPLPKSKVTFNQTNDQVGWAWRTWNPITGCLHNCPYCYAREGAEVNPNLSKHYPFGFKPTFFEYRLDAPANTKVPEAAKDDPRWGRVFVGSMGDMFGKWVPQEWIEKVLAKCIENPQWVYLFLTKFPHRYVELIRLGLQLPPTAWIGTTVDEQYRVKIAEEAFRQISGVGLKWLSLEPLLAPLQFTDLSMFDWVVIGAQSATMQPGGVHVPEFAPPFEWVARLTDQAHEAGCRVWQKHNLLGIPNSQSPGMKLVQEEPRPRIIRPMPQFVVPVPPPTSANEMPPLPPDLDRNRGAAS